MRYRCRECKSIGSLGIFRKVWKGHKLGWRYKCKECKSFGSIEILKKTIQGDGKMKKSTMTDTQIKNQLMDTIWVRARLLNFNKDVLRGLIRVNANDLAHLRNILLMMNHETTNPNNLRYETK